MYYVIENHKNIYIKKKCKTILITLSYHLYHVLCKHEKSVDFVVVRQIQEDIKTNLLRYKCPAYAGVRASDKCTHCPIMFCFSPYTGNVK